VYIRQKNQQSFNEDNLSTNIFSSALDKLSNIKDFKDINIKSMINIDHQQNRDEEFNCELYTVVIRKKFCSLVY
jgi:hypothetical protein